MLYERTTSRGRWQQWRLDDERNLYWSGAGPEPCYYCGDLANSIDHVLPSVYLIGLSPEALLALPKLAADTVPACVNCNSLLGASFQESLALRKQELKTRLRKRWARLLDATPEWTEDDLDGLAEGYFKDSIIAQLAYREHILERLRW